MARYKRKVPPADPVAARSWIGKFVRDTRLDEMGLVHAVLQVPAGVRLLARFPDEDESRAIALEATPNGEYLLPGDVRARYRPPTDSDREFLKVLAERSHRRPLIVRTNQRFTLKTRTLVRSDLDSFVAAYRPGERSKRLGVGRVSLIELAAGLVVLWLFSGVRPISERRAQQLIAVSFYLLATYVGVEALRDLAGAAHPHTSWVGIALAGVAAATMPPLAIAKARVGKALGSAAATSESRQSWLCAYLSLALLVGLGGNAAFGWWWLDPIVGLVIVGAALREGRSSWRGQSCCTNLVVGAGAGACDDDCCR